MNISSKIKALLSLRGVKQSDLMTALDMSSKQSLSNKFTNNRWSAEDLVKVSEFVGCQLAFILPNGERIVLDSDSSN